MVYLVDFEEAVLFCYRFPQFRLTVRTTDQTVLLRAVRADPHALWQQFFHTAATERKGDFTNTMVRIYEFRGCLSHGCPRCFKSSMDKTTVCYPSAHQVNLSWILYRKKSTYSKQGSGSSLSGRAIGNLMLRPALVLQAILTSHDFHIRSRHSTKAIHGFLWGSRLRCTVVWGRRRNPKRRNPVRRRYLPLSYRPQESHDLIGPL